ncbi:hypothetical protein B0T09DRAFT_13168 [Sordaria sp. MPI-SDFR-AT-0083]|nr:hypothetical protein B0T09DRAFT_13168 [Sordaria sp. MPI-SDFR-AT-0083]
MGFTLFWSVWSSLITKPGSSCLNQAWVDLLQRGRKHREVWHFGGVRRMDEGGSVQLAGRHAEEPLSSPSVDLGRKVGWLVLIPRFIQCMHAHGIYGKGLLYGVRLLSGRKE